MSSTLPRSTLSPYTTLFRSLTINNLAGGVFDVQGDGAMSGSLTFNNAGTFRKSAGNAETGFYNAVFNNTGTVEVQSGTDRKSTRLNSSHMSISYAVCCLTKK